jgi:hypothetical protein
MNTLLLRYAPRLVLIIFHTLSIVVFSVFSDLTLSDRFLGRLLFLKVSLTDNLTSVRYTVLLLVVLRKNTRANNG